MGKLLWLNNSLLKAIRMLNLETRKWYDAIIILNNYGDVRSTKNALGWMFPENKKFKTQFRRLQNWRLSEGLCSVLFQCSVSLWSLLRIIITDCDLFKVMYVDSPSRSAYAWCMAGTWNWGVGRFGLNITLAQRISNVKRSQQWTEQSGEMVNA